MKNIVIICHDSSMSGANMSLIDWINEIDKENYKLYIVLPKKNKIMEDKIKSFGHSVIIGNYTVSVKHLYKQSLTETLKSILKYIYSKTINPISMKILINKLKKLNIDIIHSNSFATLFGVKIAIKMQLPHVWHIREFMEEDHKITHFNKKDVSNYCKYSTAIFISEVIKEKYDMVFNNNSIVIYDKIEYDKNYKKTREIFEEGNFNLAIIGTLSDNKGQIEAIKAQKLLIEKGYNTNLLIIGDGPNRNFLETYVENEEIKNITFLGHQKNVTELRKNIDVVLVCSKNEALGRVTVEGMYYNNLVIGANTGCTKYIVQNNYNGLLYEAGNVEDLAEKVIYSVKNKSEIEKIIDNAFKYSIKTFYETNYVSRIYEVYNKLIK